MRLGLHLHPEMWRRERVNPTSTLLQWLRVTYRVKARTRACMLPVPCMGVGLVHYMYEKLGLRYDCSYVAPTCPNRVGKDPLRGHVVLGRYVHAPPGNEDFS